MWLSSNLKKEKHALNVFLLISTKCSTKFLVQTDINSFLEMQL